MGRHSKRGTAREQEARLPPRVEDDVGENNPVRAIEADGEGLDRGGLGFIPAQGELSPGQPAFEPRGLLKLAMFGSLQRGPSSRRRARECRGNREVIGLREGLTPGYRPIAQFRRLNAQAVRAPCRDFVALGRERALLGRR
jgi:transposase